MDNKDRDRKQLTIISEDGSREVVEVIAAFKFKDNNQQYVVYTQNEKDQNNNVTVYVSRLIEEGDTPEILQRRVMEQAEWIILPRAIDMIANGKV